MPTSISVSAGFFKRDSFQVWNPGTLTFGPRTITGRKKRIDAFVSLWHRSSRRDHIYVLPEEDVSGILALRSTTGIIYLISGTQEADSWQGDDNRYEYLLRGHKVTSPSGGAAEHYPVRVAGSGDDLGPVVLGPAAVGYADTELRSTSEPREQLQIAEAEYFLAYTGNWQVQDGDFVKLDGAWYRIMELNFDSGYYYARAKQDAPRFQTAEFKLPSTTPGVFDPRTGKLTAGTEMTRQVSVLIKDQTRLGQLAQHQISERLELYIYQAHIGFMPRLGHGVLLDNVRYTVDEVGEVTNEKQWRVVVTR